MSEDNICMCEGGAGNICCGQLRAARAALLAILDVQDYDADAGLREAKDLAREVVGE